VNPAEFGHIAAAERDFWWYRGMREILFAMLEPHLARRPVRRALDAGSGIGYLALLMQTERRWPVIPLEISKEGLHYARKTGVDRLVQGDTTVLPFGDGIFDLALSMDVFVHLRPHDEELAIRELARVLAVGGIIAIRVAALRALRSRHSTFIDEKQRFTRTRLVQLVAGAGLRVLCCSYLNAFLLPVALAKFRIWEPLMRTPPSSGVEQTPDWLNNLFYGVLRLEKSWLTRGGRFPVGQSLILIGEKTA
jgi:SAM-dependent methyltransferase